MKPIAFLFIDTENTGVHEGNEVWQFGWILDIDGQIVSNQNFYLKHNDKPTKWVLKNTNYNEIFSEKSNFYIVPEVKFVLGELYLDLQPYWDTYDIHVIGAAVNGDYKWLLEMAKDNNMDLHLHWRTVDISPMFVGYQFAKGNTEYLIPTNVPNILKTLGLKSSGKRHGVDIDNQDVRNIYYAMKNNF